MVYSLGIAFHRVSRFTPQRILQTQTQSDHEAETVQSQEFRAHVGQISSQSGFFFAGTVFSAIFGYGFKIYLARTLGAEALGVYALGITLIGLIGIFNNLGLPESAVRFVAQYQATGQFQALHALLWRGASFLLVANIVFAALLLLVGPWVAVHFYHSTVLAHYLPWFAPLMVLGTLTHFYGKVLAGYKDLHRRTLIVNFIGSPLYMLAAILLISAGLGLSGYLAAQVISAVIVLGLLFAAVRSLTPRPARYASQPGQPLQSDVVSFSSAMIGIGLMEFLMVQVDKISLGYFRGAREVGVYAVAAAVVAYISIALHSVNQIFSPMIAGLHSRGDHVMLSRLFQSLTKWVLALTLPLAIVVMVFSRIIMRVFGHDFDVGWSILIIGTLGQLVNCGVGSVGFLLLMSGNQKRLFRVQIYMAIGMVVLSVLLVPIWGAIGAAIAAMFTNVGMNAWNLLQVRRALGLQPYNRSYLKLLPATAAVLLLVLALRHYANWFVSDWGALGAALFLAYGLFAALSFALGLNDDDHMITGAIWTRIATMLGRSEPGEAS